MHAKEKTRAELLLWLGWLQWLVLLFLEKRNAIRWVSCNLLEII